MTELRDVFAVYRGYDHDVAALRGLSLTVAPEERLVVHGPSGSGKTSLLRILAGELEPAAGWVAVDGPIGLVDQRAWSGVRREISCRANVELGLALRGGSGGADRRLADALLERVGLGPLATRQPATLSGGELQRVAVCAALVHEPRLILADEPTGELDAASADAVYDLLSELATSWRASLVIVSHDPRAARVADRVVQIRDGRLSEERAAFAEDALVVDDRGWVRVPEPVRRAAGVGRLVRAALGDGGGIVLTPVGGDELPLRPFVEAPLPPSSSGIVAEMRVSHRYGGQPVLDDFALELERGALTVLQGRSGSGKSTVLRLLAGLERPTVGAVSVTGTALASLDRAALARLRRRSLAFVAQHVALAESLDAAGNVALARSLRGCSDGDDGQRLVDALGLEHLRGRPARHLSGGERQRVALARALATARPVVLLDEPTSAIDEATAERVAAVLRAHARQGVAILCATHDPVLLAAADRTIDVER